MKISACMIAKNEEKNIEKCINSYKEIVDEIIVVDTGSKDRTVELAEILGAKVYFFEWINDFAAAKNYALDKAKGDWIIFLDADEYFDSNSIEEIRKILTSLNGTKYSAIGCKMINIDKINDKIIDSFMQVRIFKNDKRIRYKSSIHESLSKKDDKLHIISFYNDIQIYHTGYSSNINKEKAKRNLEILLENIKSNGEDKEYYRYLCDCYFSIEDYENALKYGELHLKSGVKVIGYESRIHKVIIDCMWKLDRSKQDIELKIKEAISIFPGHPNFYCSYAFFLLDERRYGEALNNFLVTLDCNKNYKGIEVNLIIGLIHYINFKIGTIYEMKNCYEKALEYYYLSLNKNKFNKEAFCAAFKIIRKEKLEDIIEFLNSIYNINNEKEVQFIIDELIKIKSKSVLLYYTNLWYKKFGHEDSSLTFTLLAEGKFQTSFNIFYKGYVQDYNNSNLVLAIVSAILGEDYSNIELLLKSVRPSFKRILRAFMEEESNLYEEDVEDYITVLRELVLFNNLKAVNKYINLNNNFKINILSKIAKVLMDNCKYEEALELYEKYNEEFNIKEAYMAIGYCYYKVKDYQNAYVNLQKAISMGYTDNDVYEYIGWIKEQSGDI